MVVKVYGLDHIQYKFTHTTHVSSCASAGCNRHCFQNVKAKLSNNGRTAVSAETYVILLKRIIRKINH